MSSSNPRRTPVTRRSESDDGLRLKTTNLTLRKGATFHSPTSPTSPPTVLARVVPSLPRRSNTTLDDVVDAHRRRAALKLDQIDVTLSSKTERASTRSKFRDDSFPLSQSLLEHIVINDKMARDTTPIEGESERRVLRPRQHRSSRHHESDSGLGSSIASKRSSKPTGAAAAITRSASSTETESLPRLSQRAFNRIHEHTLKPLLEDTSLKDFHPIVLDCPRRISENQIVCLRDLEKTLLFMAPERAKSSQLFLDFALTSVRCIQATVEYLSDREQTRPHDRPYSSGYFIDLVEQLRMHAQQMQQDRERQAAGDDADEMAVDSTDEIKLVGGLSKNGRPAQLVRVKKNGVAIDASGKTVEHLEDEEDVKSPIRFKRSMSEQLEDEEEILRSMARRKKNASPAELAPKKCKEPGCNKEFKRPCDLTKHEKTHSRPWKCPHSTCKYHEYGWPTEKEMDRHINDKHSDAPAMYECLYKPCPYKSKRESNCKQHMEKAHGWTYVRTKTNGKKGTSKDGSSAHPTPMIPSMPTPSSDRSHSVVPMMTPPEDAFGYQDMTFPSYPSSEEFNATMFDGVPFEGDIQLDYSPMDNDTPSTDAGQFSTYQELSPEMTAQFEDIYGAHVQLPTPTHSVYTKPTELFTSFVPSVTQAPAQVPHISPVGHGNTMLYTPSSLADVDEGFDEYSANDQLGNDFLLFPPTNKSADFDSNLFLPSAAAGYSQPSSQDFNIDYNPTMDWSATDYNYSQQH